MPNIPSYGEKISSSFRTTQPYFGKDEVSSKIFLAMSKKPNLKPKPKPPRGDPQLLDRLNRARGAYLARTGKDVQWQELAEVAGIGLSTMTDITTLNRKVTIQDAIAFADYLGVEFAWLAAGRGPMELARLHATVDYGTTHSTGGDEGSDENRRKA